MQIFATRVWGFDPKGWPIICFHREGDRDALVRSSRPGDRIVFVGTKTEETEPEDRGRLLGIAEIGRTAVDSDDVIDLSTVNSIALDDNGRIRWPKALPMLRAWRFIEPPPVTEVLRHQLGYEATSRAVLLSHDDAAAILLIPSEEIPVTEAPAIKHQRKLQSALQSGATTGPRPSTWTGETGRDASEASFTYAFQFGKRDVWKIGHAKDVKARLAEVNKHVPSEVLGEMWKVVLSHRWPCENDAYDMEQRVLAALRTPTSIGERVSCGKSKLESVWTTALTPIG